MSVLPSSWFTALDGETVLFPFIQITGDLTPVADRPERVIYPGANGVGFWFNGSRGEPFSIGTTCDYANQTAAFAAYAAYLATVGTQLDLYYLGVFWGSVIIHDVTLQSVNQMATTVGGCNVTSGSSSAIITASWKIETLYE